MYVKFIIDYIHIHSVECVINLFCDYAFMSFLMLLEITD